MTDTALFPDGAPLNGGAPDRLLARVAYEAIWVWDFETERISWEGNVKSIFGYERDEVEDLVGWWRDRVHPQDRERVEDVAISATRSDSRGYSVEYRFRRKDGSWAWVASRSIIERDSQGRARRAVGAMIDISVLKEIESRLHLFTEQIPVRACVTDRDLKVMWDAGAAFSESPSAVGRTIPELFAQSPDRERVLDGCRKALAGQSSLVEIDDGTSAAQLCLRPFHDPAGNVTGVVGLAVDITARVRTEEKVRAGERLLRQVLETLPVGVAVVDRAGDIVLSNSASTEIWGGTVVSGVDRRARSKGFWHGSGEPIRPDDWASVRAVKEGQTSSEELIDIETYDGRRKTIQNYAAPLRDAKGAITGAVVVNEEVTERVRAEEALRQTEQLLVEAERLGQTGSWEEDLKTGQVFNTEASRYLFFGKDPDKGSRVGDYAEAVHPDDREGVMRRRAELLAGTGSRDIEFRVIWPDGSLHWIFGRATIIRDDAGRPIRMYGTNADVTTRKRTEDEMRAAAERLQQLSRRLLEIQEEERRHLARELHDEFGQLLATITLLLHAAKTVAGPAAQSRLDECGVLLRKAGDQVRTLALELRPAMLDVGLEEALRALADQHRLRTGVAVEVVGHVTSVPGDQAIAAFRVVQEALTNVVRHAAARHVWIELQQSDTVLSVTVRDDGRGFDVRSTLDQAPRDGHLGLLGMRERVQILAGQLEVESQMGQGTRIRVGIPLAGRGAGRG